MGAPVFTSEEEATIRKFFAWIEDGKWLGYDEAITGLSEEGVLVTEYEATSDYDSYTLERTEMIIPWIAMRDPDEYARQQAEADAERKREAARQRAASMRQQEMRERAAYDALRQKYG